MTRREAEAVLSIYRLPALVALPTRRSWGEAWWTARDVCVTNQPEWPDPIQAIADAFSDELVRAFIYGDAS